MGLPLSLGLGPPSGWPVAEVTEMAAPVEEELGRIVKESV